MSMSLVRTSLLASVLVAVGAASGAVACSSDPAASPGGTDGGAGADGSSGGTGPDGGDGGSGGCGATTPVTNLGAVDANAFELVSAGDYVVVRDNTAGLDTPIPGAKTGGLVRVPKAGGAAELALAPTAPDRRISGFHAEGNVLYAIDYKAGTPSDTSVIRKTLPGGAVETLGITGLFDGMTATIVASDAANLYFRGFPNGGGGARIYRAPKAGGAVELVTKHAGANADVFNVHLVGDTFWFTEGVGGKSTFYTAPASGNDVAPTKIDRPNQCFGNIVVAAAGVACLGGTKAYGYDPAFTGEKLLFDSNEGRTVELAVPALIDGTRVLLVESASLPSVPLRAVPIGGGPVTNLTCDRARIIDLRADETHFYWLEDRGNPGAKTRSVYKLAK